MSEASVEVREKLLQGVLVLEDRISAEELEPFERREEMKGNLNEWRRIEAKGPMETDAAGGGVTCILGPKLQGRDCFL